MKVQWVGKRTLTGGRLEVGRVWLAWAGRSGWSTRSFNIGRTRVFYVGPLAVFVGPKR